MDAVQAPPTITLVTGPAAGRAFEVRGTLRLGRHPYNDASLNDPGISRYHCWITFRDGAPTLEDLASANGTFVNGRRVATRCALQPGDRIRIGATEIVFTTESSPIVLEDPLSPREAA